MKSLYIIRQNEKKGFCSGSYTLLVLRNKRVLKANVKKHYQEYTPPPPSFIISGRKVPFMTSYQAVRPWDNTELVVSTQQVSKGWEERAELGWPPALKLCFDSAVL